MSKIVNSLTGRKAPVLWDSLNLRASHSTLKVFTASSSVL